MTSVSGSKSSAMSGDGSGGGPEIRPDAFRFPSLRAAPTTDHYDLHIAALEWSLDSPITIRGEADIQSKRIWAERFEPYAHQVQNLITFCRRAPVALLADDVGLGKTISAGLILSELMVRKKVSRALVVAPKLLLPQWQEELAVKFGIPAEPASGAQLSGAVRRSIPVVVTTYHSLRSYLDDIRRANFDMVVLDEAHKLRNLHGTAQAPQFALGVRQALADRAFKFVLMLTATPIQNRLWDLYSLIDLLTAAKGHTNPLGSSESFRTHYIEDTRGVQIRRGRREEFRQHLSNYIVRTRRSDAKLVFPTRHVKTYRVAASEPERRLLTLVGELFRDRALNGLSQSSIGQALMSSPEALASQLQEMAQRGTVPRELAGEVARVVVPGAVSGKLSGLTALIQELAAQRPLDWRVVIFTSRTKTQQAIGDHLRQLKIPVGFISGSRQAENERAIRAFKERPPGIRALVSTDAGAEGINLQAANVLVNYDLPWNPMVLEQRIGRIQRLASTHAEVTVLNLVLAGSVEEKVVARLGEKLQAISESLGDIEGILESAAQATDEEDSFETMIRKLVVDSLKGLDVEQATRKAMESIEEAKALFQKEQDTVERTLGDLRDLHRTGPRVPEITPVTPSIDSRDFVVRALARDGARIRPLDGDVLAVTLPGQNEFRLTFKERATTGGDFGGVFTGNAPRLFVPGKRDFERLAQSWAEKAGALIIDRSRPTDEQVEQCLSEWLGAVDGFSLADFTLGARQEGFLGDLTCRASIAVAHDRLEKLVTVPLRSGIEIEVEPICEEERTSSVECNTTQLAQGMRELVTAAIAAEPDLTKFADFYRKRLDEELEAASDAARQRRLREQFTAVAAADAVAVRGVRYAQIEIAAQVRIDGEGPYQAGFRIVPGSKSISVSPSTEWVACQSTGRMVPVDATDVCSITGTRVLIHLLVRSAASGRLALRGRMVRCDETHVLLLPDETEVCQVSGRRVRLGLLSKSAVSGRAVMPSELVRCEFTGDLVLPDELQQSDVSGKKFRVDQAGVSVLSGRTGHRTEFVAAVLPQGMIACDEAAKSDVSGAWADSRQLIRSERPPGRLGLPSEGVRSEVSGRLVLRDEVVGSDVSGKPGLPDELETCEFTAARCLPRELLASDISGRRYRVDQQAISVVSKRSGHVTEFVSSDDPPGLLALDEAERSDASGKWAQRGRLRLSDVPPHRRALADELVTSAVSGKRVLPDEVERSAVSGRPALPSELVACEFSGERVLADELLVSEISGKRLRSDRACTSAHSGRRGHPDEFVDSVLPAGRIALDEAESSAVSGLVAARDHLVASEVPPHRLGLPSEMVASAVSGLRVLRDEVRASEISDAIALPEELRSCDITGAKVLPAELLTSEISGKQFRSDQQVRSVLSGRSGHAREFVESILPAGMIATDEAACSDVSGAVAARDRMVLSDAPEHRIGLPEEQVVSAASGKRYLRDEVQRSELSDAVAHPSELQACEFTGVRGIPQEFAASDVSRKRCRRDELMTSALSGRSGHSSEFVRSVAPTGWIAKDEAAVSALSGEWGAKAMLRPSSRPPHRLGLSHEVVMCGITNLPLLRDEVDVSAVSGKLVDDALLVPSAASGKRAIAEEMVVCQATGRRLLPSEVSTCAITGMRVDARELTRSEVSGVPGQRTLMVLCPETRKLLLPTEVTCCCLTGHMVLSSEIESCSLTGRHALRRLMRQCPTSGGYYIDDAESQKRMSELTGSADLLSTCQWTGHVLLSNRLERCAITGLRVEQGVLNGERELAALRRLLDGLPVVDSQPLTPDSVAWLRSAHQELRNVQEVLALRNQSGRALVGAARVRAGVLGLSTVWVAVAASIGKPSALLCEPVPGKRGHSGWARLTK